MTSVSPASSSFAFPRPHSPPKPATTLSNAHPYPIKTTSTALLSRSNSTSSSAAPPRHHYVPPSPSQSPSPRREREAYRGHRYSRSLSSSDDLHLPGGAGGVQGPRALPIPPKSAGANGDVNGNQNNGDISPKRWTSVQLAAHLGTTVSREAGEWAAQRGIGGRAFMRLTEEDLVAMGAFSRYSPSSSSFPLLASHRLAPSTSSSSSRGLLMYSCHIRFARGGAVSHTQLPLLHAAVSPACYRDRTRTLFSISLLLFLPCLWSTRSSRFFPPLFCRHARLLSTPLHSFFSSQLFLY
ncbi:hypothetical protein B0H10DRAFT_338813 [Mycena sp. CBHHK59/15]|nr:hypothetical protein B0H10DRAFT_338813 [Mycena sp. CBHHK59/15]